MPNKLTTPQYIKKVSKIHNNKYDYSKLEYIDSKSKVKIICPIHGEFEQTAKRHYHAGCLNCSFIETGKTKAKDGKITFEEKLKNLDTPLDLTKVQYINAKTKVCVTCPIHGQYWTLPANLTKGCNCKKCSSFDKSEIWSHSGWGESAQKSKSYTGFKLYILRCFNETEAFFKIGKTYLNINRRFSSKKSMPYKYDIIDTIISKDFMYISKIENNLHKLNKNFKYIPKIIFNGSNECFSNIKYNPYLLDLEL